MKVPNNIIKCLKKDYGNDTASIVQEKWFLLTLDNYRFLEDGDAIGFINCDTCQTFMGHLFKDFSKDWRKMRIYYNTVRRVKSRVIEIEVERNLFFFRKLKHNDAFSIYYMLSGLENGNVVFKN